MVPVVPRVWPREGEHGQELETAGHREGEVNIEKNAEETHTQPRPREQGQGGVSKRIRPRAASKNPPSRDISGQGRKSRDVF